MQPGQLLLDPVEVGAVVDWPTPSSRKQLQRFLGFANFYRGFVCDYSKVVTLPSYLTSTFRQFQLSDEAETAFSKQKTLFTSALILSHPDPSRQFIMEVDASAIRDSPEPSTSSESTSGGPP